VLDEVPGGEVATVVGVEEKDVPLPIRLVDIDDWRPGPALGRGGPGRCRVRRERSIGGKVRCCSIRVSTSLSTSWRAPAGMRDNFILQWCFLPEFQLFGSLSVELEDADDGDEVRRELGATASSLGGAFCSS
jgi:hypothetical protein